MEPSAKLLAHLLRVRSLSFSSAHPGSPDRNAKGSGNVESAAPDDRSILFTESGTWAPRNGKSFRFHNAYRWSRLSAASVRLEHLRLGPANPTHLLDLRPEDATAARWTSRSPHFCGDDSYWAQLLADETGFVLRWRITGPRKDERLVTVYAFAPSVEISRSLIVAPMRTVCELHAAQKNPRESAADK